MSRLTSTRHIPAYHGKSYINAKLPRKARDWTEGNDKSIATDCTKPRELAQTLKKLNKEQAWSWPKRPVFFFSDLHGDPEAFEASLVASGGIRKNGPNQFDFTLTARGQKANFIIGGDCFDKGPSSLNLLRVIYCLKKQGARVRVLAGNHDVRVLFGMQVVGKHKTLSNEHFFIRTGQKIIPLLKEVWDEYLADGQALKGVPNKKKCKKRLYPRESWFEEFPEMAEGRLNPYQVKRELTRIRKKYDTFESKCRQAGLNLRQVYAAVQKWKDLFLQKDGEFYWLFKLMRLSYRNGSLLFIHAGLDNKTAKELSRVGVKDLNRRFKAALSGDPFEFYYGPLCNTVRTKYRNVDHPFTQKGTRYIRKSGIAAIIHGHRNLHYGQRLALRAGMLNFECDASLDRQTRAKEKVRGRGAAVTIIDPKGHILGISSDYPHAKMFDPDATLKKLTANPAKRKKEQS